MSPYNADVCLSVPHFVDSGRRECAAWKPETEADTLRAPVSFCSAAVCADGYEDPDSDPNSLQLYTCGVTFQSPTPPSLNCHPCVFVCSSFLPTFLAHSLRSSPFPSPLSLSFFLTSRAKESLNYRTCVFAGSSFLPTFLSHSPRPSPSPSPLWTLSIFLTSRAKESPKVASVLFLLLVGVAPSSSHKPTQT